MSLVPTFQPRKPEWRGNSSSEDMNSNFEEILYDLNTIFSEASKQAISLDELGSTLKHETDALNERLYAVSGVMSALLQAEPGHKMFHEEFYRSRNIVYPESLSSSERCYLDTAFGMATLPVSNSFSKVYTIAINTGEIYQSPDLVVSVTAVDEDANVGVEETNPLRAFNGNNQAFWERKVRYDRDYLKGDVRCKMEILLPSTSNPDVNSFSIFPYPEGTVDLESITYNTLTSQNNVLPGFSSSGEENVTRTKYLFDSIQPIGFTLNFKQDNYGLEDDYNTYVYGAQEIAIEQVEYKPKGWIGVKFTLPEWETGVFSKITSIKTSPTYDNYKYKLYLYPSKSDFDADIPIWASTSSALTPENQLDVSMYASESMYILIELTQGLDSTSTPAMDSLTMTYTTE